MTENEKIAALLFPHITMTPADYEAKSPPRQLKEGARVSRFSPSPTGFLHFGNLFSCAAAYRTARCTDGSRYPMPEIACKAGTSDIAECRARYDANTVVPLTFMKAGA